MSYFTRGFVCLSILVAGLLVAPGCAPKSPDKKVVVDSKTKDEGAKKGAHDHPSEGPHGGALAEEQGLG